MIIARSLLAAGLLAYSSGFPVTQIDRRYSNVMVLSSSLSSNNNVPSDDMLRKDIEVLREEAKERLQSLNLQMEDFLSHHQPESSFPDSSSFEDAELPLVEQLMDHAATKNNPPFVEVKNIPTTTTTITNKQEKQQIAPPRHFLDSKLLEGTRWKVVIQVGSARAEAGEKPLMLHLVVEFTPEANSERDELLQGSANAKVLEIKEAWVGAQSTTEGRQRSVPIKATGGWKVLPGQGPKGIDILRLYIDVEEEICHGSFSSSCPAGRVYCTSGFFSMEHHNEAEVYKNHLRDELGRLVNLHEDLALERERDDSWLSLDQVRRTKKMMELRKQIKAMNTKITQARVRDPEKAMLRLSRKGDVGVTREGQVCYKDDTKGPSSEYLVLGKMEMASINKPIIESTNDPDKLRP